MSAKSKEREMLIEKWGKQEGKMSIASIKDEDVKSNIAQLLENQATKDIEGDDMFSGMLAEDSAATINTYQLSTDSVPGTNMPTGDGWRFRPVTLALVRRTFPDLFANKIVGVQAMSTPVGLAYALRVMYSDGLNEAAWDKVAQYAGYTGSQTGVSAALAGSSPETSANTGIYDTSGVGQNVSAAEGWDIRNPNIYNAFTTVAGELSGSPANAYTATQWPQLKLKIDQRAIVANTRKLAASFSIESAQDIRAMHGIDIEREMVNILQYEITAELDRELIYNLKNNATTTTNGGANISAIDLTGSGTTSGAYGIDGRWSGEKYMNIIASIIHQSNMIAIATRRGAGNYAVVSPSIATSLQAAGHTFVQYTQNVNPTTTMASIGKLNGNIEVYRDQYALTDFALVGYKGPGIADSGLLFCPYLMGLTNRAINPSDFSPRVGVISRYAIVNSLLGAGRYNRLLAFYNVSKLIAGAGATTEIVNQNVTSTNA